MARKINEIQGSIIFQDYYNRLKSIAVSQFEWGGLPETCNERFLEETLFHLGAAIFVEDRDLSYLNLKVTPADRLNVYNEPLAYTAYSTGYNKIYNADECVYIRNNRLAVSTESTIILFAERLARIEQAIQVNINAQRTPILIRADDKTKRTLQEIYRLYSGDAPVILGTNSLQEKPLECLTTGAPYVADRLRDEKRAVWNEALEFLGFNTNPSDKKKERLIVSEVNANDEQILMQGESRLLCRQEAAVAINRKYPRLNVSVKMRVRKNGSVNEDIQSIGGEYDGKIYD